MKPALLLLTSSLLFASTGAFAQGTGAADACHNQYGSCMERCSGRPQSLQESCSQSCEANTNQCYSGMYGQPSGAQTVQSAPDQSSAQAPDASEARDEAKPKKKKKH